MRRNILIANIALIVLTAAVLAAPAPEYTAEGKLKMPADYREWVFLSSGLGMTYGPAASENTAANPLFDNVFVTPAAYREFVKSGHWPDKTVFVLEVRRSQSKGSINNGGHFQDQIAAIEVEVKDESRPSKWTFFGFNNNATEGTPFPATASCYSCHAKNGSVDNTFVQFYPSILPVAKSKGTFRDTAVNE